MLRFWWVKIGALAEMRKWDELEKLARSKKSPIGYVVRACICRVPVSQNP
jgi:hypothetical protein